MVLRGVKLARMRAIRGQAVVIAQARSAHLRKERPSCAFTAASFRVPKEYLALLLGPAVARRLMARHAKEIPADTDWMPSVLFLKLCLERMRTTGEETFGIAAHPVAKGTFGILMAAAGQGADLAGALKRFCAAASLLRTDIVVEFSRSRRGPTVRLDYAGARDARKELLLETFALTIHCGFRWLTGRPLRPAHVGLAEPIGIFRKTVLKDVLGAPCSVKGRGVTLGYSGEDAAAPLAAVKYDTWAAHEFVEFMALLEEAAERRNRHDGEAVLPVLREVCGAIAGGATSEIEVARLLRVSPATMRRRLAEAGTSFRAQFDRAQRETAAILLMTDKSLEDIAAEIRYSDVRSFRRACRRWFGTTPAAYRQGRAAG